MTAKNNKSKKVTRRLAIALAMVIAFTGVGVPTSFNNMATVQAAIAADTEVPIVTSGYGTIKKTLTTNEEATVVVDDCLMTVNVGNDKLNYLANKISDEDARRVVGKAVISDDDLLHFLHLDGKYYVMDLRYSSFTIVEAWRSNTTHKYVSKDPATSYEVHGFTIMSNTQFKEVTPGTVDDKTVENLMTRAEFESILNPNNNGGNGNNDNNGGNGDDGNGNNNPGGNGENGNGNNNPGGNGDDGNGNNNPGGNGDNGNGNNNPGGNGNSGNNGGTTTQPTITDVKGDIDIDWLNQKRVDGTITWEDLQKILWQANWDAERYETNTETTYYYYDDQNRLIKTVVEGKTAEVSNGTAQGAATVEEKGAAKVNLTETDKGQATVKVDVQAVTDNSAAQKAAEAAQKAAEALQQAAAASAQSVSNNKSQWATVDGETYYHVKRKGNSVLLERRKAKKTGSVCKVYFKKKTGVAKFDGIKYTNIKYVGYTAITKEGAKKKLTHQIIMITKDGKVYIVPRTKGQIGKIYTKKVLKGKWYYPTENNAGLTIRVSDKKSKVKGVKDAQPKRIK